MPLAFAGLSEPFQGEHQARSLGFAVQRVLSITSATSLALDTVLGGKCKTRFFLQKHNHSQIPQLSQAPAAEVSVQAALGGGGSWEQ